MLPLLRPLCFPPIGARDGSGGSAQRSGCGGASSPAALANTAHGNGLQRFSDISFDSPKLRARQNSHDMNDGDGGAPSLSCRCSCGFLSCFRHRRACHNARAPRSPRPRGDGAGPRPRRCGRRRSRRPWIYPDRPSAPIFRRHSPSAASSKRALAPRRRQGMAVAADSFPSEAAAAASAMALGADAGGNDDGERRSGGRSTEDGARSGLRLEGGCGFRAARRSDRCVSALRTYWDRDDDGIHLYGLDFLSGKFKAWVKHRLEEEVKDRGGGISSTEVTESVRDDLIAVEEVRIDDPAVREELRGAWKRGHLLSGRIDALTYYRSDAAGTIAHDAASEIGEVCSFEEKDMKRTRTRGDFPDSLAVYANRLMDMLRDKLGEKCGLGGISSAGLEDPERLPVENG